MRRLIGGALLVALACGCNPPSDNPSTTSTTTMNSGPASSAPAMATSGSPEGAASGAPAMAASGSPAGGGKTVKLPDGLQYEDQAVGSGPEAKAGDTVSVNYVGTLTNGNKFDATADHGGQPFVFPLGAHKVIAGWDEGVAGMKKGGKRHLVIPPELGYGPRAMGDKIPANSTLVFDVELLDINPK